MCNKFVPDLCKFVIENESFFGAMVIILLTKFVQNALYTIRKCSSDVFFKNYDAKFSTNLMQTCPK